MLPRHMCAAAAAAAAVLSCCPVINTIILCRHMCTLWYSRVVPLLLCFVAFTPRDAARAYMRHHKANRFGPQQPPVQVFFADGMPSRTATAAAAGGGSAAGSPSLFLWALRAVAGDAEKVTDDLREAGLVPKSVSRWAMNCSVSAVSLQCVALCQDRCTVGLTGTRAGLLRERLTIVVGSGCSCAMIQASSAHYAAIKTGVALPAWAASFCSGSHRF